MISASVTIPKISAVDDGLDFLVAARLKIAWQGTVIQPGTAIDLVFPQSNHCGGHVLGMAVTLAFEASDIRTGTMCFSGPFNDWCFYVVVNNRDAALELLKATLERLILMPELIQVGYFSPEDHCWLSYHPSNIPFAEPNYAAFKSHAEELVRKLRLWIASQENKGGAK